MKKIQAETLIDFMKKYEKDIISGYRNMHNVPKEVDVQATFTVDMRRRGYVATIYIWLDHDAMAVMTPEGAMKYIKWSS